MAALFFGLSVYYNIDQIQLGIPGKTMNTKLNEAAGLSSYETFIKDHRIKINRYLNLVLWCFIATGPVIATGVRAGIFPRVTYYTCAKISLIILILAVIHSLLLKKIPDAEGTSFFPLIALNILLFFMSFSHVSVLLTWFLVPLLSLLFCDRRIYIFAVIFNFLLLTASAVIWLPFNAGWQAGLEGSALLISDYLGGVAIETVVMAIAGYVLGATSGRYLREVINKHRELFIKEQQMEERMNILDSMAEIYDNVNLLNFIKGTEMSLRDEELIEIPIDMTKQTHTAMNRRLMNNVSPDHLQDFLEFTNITTVRMRLTDKKIISRDFPDRENGWFRAQYITSDASPDGIPNIVVYTTRNISEEKRRHDELMDISERALAANEAKSVFLSNMSHEIRTPLNAVLGMNEMILRDCRDENVLFYSENIDTAGRTLLGIINDILDISKIEAGKMEIIPVDYDLTSLLNDLVSMVKVRAANKGLTLLLDFNPGTPSRLRGDEIRLKQIMTNLLTNAVKYTEKGTVTFSLDFIQNEGRQDMVWLKVSVKDTGTGIRPEDLDKVFSKFERVDEKRNRHIEGTGLGLNITKQLLELMKSSLEVESEYGKGSKFSFVLPQEVTEWVEMGDFEEKKRRILSGRESYHESFRAPDAQILVADDNEVNLSVFTSLLRRTELKIDTAINADEALKAAAEKKYDVIFLDHMMPDKDGIEALHELKSGAGGKNALPPVICLTANAISGARERYLEAGFDDYLSKPIDSAKLEETLIKYLPEEKVERVRIDEGFAGNATGTGALLQEAADEVGIDISKGVENCGDNEEYLSVLKIFYSTLEKKTGELEESFDSKDMKSYAVRVHALKSSLRIIGAGRLSGMAEKLEFAAKNKDENTVIKDHPSFAEGMALLKKALDTVFKDTGVPGEEKKKAGRETVDLLYDRAYRAAEDMDYDALEKSVIETEKYVLDPGDIKAFNNIRSAMEMLDYDGVMDVIAKKDDK